MVELAAITRLANPDTPAESRGGVAGMPLVLRVLIWPLDVYGGGDRSNPRPGRPARCRP